MFPMWRKIRLVGNERVRERVCPKFEGIEREGTFLLEYMMVLRWGYMWSHRVRIISAIISGILPVPCCLR